MSKSSKPRGLGRGLDALLPVRTPQPAPVAAPAIGGDPDSFRCAVEKISPRKDQPRRAFDMEALEELAASIKSYGLIEPLIVRRVGEDRFELIAGERRWRAAQRAGLHEVPVFVRKATDKESFELALIENVQREDLNPIEFAEALRRLIDDYDYTQDGLAERVGKDRSTIANALRLLKLPEKVRTSVMQGQLSEGHARALLGASSAEDMQALADRVIKKQLSVRQTEAEVRALKRGGGGSKGSKGKSAATRDLELRLSRKLGARCEVRDRDGKGEIVVHYASLDDLDRILDVVL